MRITATIQDSLMKDLFLFTHTKSKTGAVNMAIQEWILYKKRQQLKELRGKLAIQDYSDEQFQLERDELGQF